MSDPTPEEIRASIIPKSDQLNADDLLTGPLTCTITKVSKGDRDQPIVVEIEGHRPYKPCKSMRRVLIAALGDDPSKWIGQRMTLYCDPEVTWAGLKVGGIRISHLSCLSEPKTFMLTTARGKRAECKVHPLTDEADIDSVRAQIAAADSMESLKSVAASIKSKSKAVQDAVRPYYSRRQKELSEVTQEG